MLCVADSQIRFLHKPQNKSAFWNESNVYFLCVATGNVSSYTWLKEGFDIGNSGIEYQLSAEGSVLMITNITSKTQGIYTCVVESKTRERISSMAWFNILSKFWMMYVFISVWIYICVHTYSLYVLYVSVYSKYVCTVHSIC